jgi:hypothetical protein
MAMMTFMEDYIAGKHNDDCSGDVSTNNVAGGEER